MLSINKKFIFNIILAVFIPAIIGTAVIYRDVKQSVAHTKLNDLMNIIDAKYIHLLDLIKNQKTVISTLSQDEGIKNNRFKGNILKIKKLENVNRSYPAAG